MRAVTIVAVVLVLLVVSIAAAIHYHMQHIAEIRDYAEKHLNATCICNGTHWIIVLRNTGPRTVSVKLLDVEDPPVAVRPAVTTRPVITTRIVVTARPVPVRSASAASTWLPIVVSATVATATTTTLMLGKYDEVTNSFVLTPNTTAVYLVWCNGKKIRCEVGKTLRLRLYIDDIEVWKTCNRVYYKFRLTS